MFFLSVNINRSNSHVCYRCKERFWQYCSCLLRVIFSYLGVCFVFRGFCASQVLRKINLLNEDCSTPTYHCFLSINLSAGGRLCDRMMNEGSDWGMHHPSLTGGSIGMTQDCYCQVPACLHNSSLGCLHKKVMGCQIAKTTLHEPCKVTYC